MIDKIQTNLKFRIIYKLKKLMLSIDTEIHKKNKVISYLILNFMGFSTTALINKCIINLTDNHKIFQFLTNFIIL